MKSLSASGEDALAWSCIDAFVLRLHDARRSTVPNASECERLERSLIASISGVNLFVLPPLLDLLEREVLSSDPLPYQSEVADQVLSRVGDAQKNVALAWWMRIHDQRPSGLGFSSTVRHTL